MLVLSRKVGQELTIGDSVRITVTRISGNRVTLGVAAPGNVRILRGELEPIARSFEDEEAEETEKPVPAPTGVILGGEASTAPFVPPTAR